MLDLHSTGAHVINVDESFLNETSFHRRLWAHKQEQASHTRKGVTPRLSLLAALDTDGRCWFSLTQANTDQKVMLAFL